jgi:hypothetical protein
MLALATYLAYLIGLFIRDNHTILTHLPGGDTTALVAMLDNYRKAAALDEGEISEKFTLMIRELSS